MQQWWFAAAVCLDRFGNNWKSSEKTLFQVPCLSNLIIIKFQFKADTLSDTLSQMYEKYNLISFVMNYCWVLSYWALALIEIDQTWEIKNQGRHGGSL